MDDKEKLPKIKEAQEDANVDRGEGKTQAELDKAKERQVTMSKKETIAAQSAMCTISIEQIKDLKKLPAAAL